MRPPSVGHVVVTSSLFQLISHQGAILQQQQQRQQTRLFLSTRASQTCRRRCRNDVSFERYSILDRGRGRRPLYYGRDYHVTQSFGGIGSSYTPKRRGRSLVSSRRRRQQLFTTSSTSSSEEGTAITTTRSSTSAAGGDDNDTTDLKGIMNDDTESSTTNDSTSSSSSSTTRSSTSVPSFLTAASKCGLDPYQNRFHCPIVYHEHYSFDGWPPNHTFPMDKFERIASSLLQRSSTSSNLPRPLVRSIDDFYRPLDLDDIPMEWITSITDNDFVTRFVNGQLTSEESKQIGFREQTTNPNLIRRTILEVIGTMLTCQLAYNYGGVACNVAGGTHHASPTNGAGYTILNDLAIASNFILNPSLNGGSIRGINKVLVIDCDVHQGDGTAKFRNIINKDETEERFVTLSIHCESNYPHPKATSTYDIGVQDGMEDDEYIDLLQATIDDVLYLHGGTCSNNKDRTSNDLFVLYDAGVDIYKGDKLGKLNISEDGIRHRDRYIIEKCVSMGIPIACVVGGGYDKDIDALARRHAILHEEAGYVWRKYQLHNKGREKEQWQIENEMVK